MQEDSSDFRGLESAWEGSGWLQNQKKSLGLSLFVWLKVGRRGASGLRIIRNAWDNQHLHGFGNRWEGGDWPQNHKKCMGLL